MRDSWLSLNVRHLAALAAVARESSLSDAADSTGYASTTVGRQIAYLERLAGHRLTTRDGGSTSLTEEGRLLLRHAHAILGELERARVDIEQTSDRTNGLTIGVAAIFGHRLPSALLSTDSILVRGRSERLLAMLEEGTIDAALVEVPIAAGPFSASEVTSEPCVLVLPATTDRPHDVPLVDVADYRVTPQLRARLNPPKPRHAAGSPASALAYVRAGVSSAVVSDSDIEADTEVQVLPLTTSRRAWSAWPGTDTATVIRHWIACGTGRASAGDELELVPGVVGSHPEDAAIRRSRGPCRSGCWRP